MQTLNKNACFLAVLLSVGALTACQKPADNNSSADNASKDQTTAAQSTQSQNAESEHDHEHHEHDGHDHAHHDDDFKSYLCGDKTVKVIVQQMEGETEARALIDDIEYDFHPDDVADAKNTFVSQDGVKGKPMLMQLSNDAVTFYDYASKTRGDVIFDCQEKPLVTAPTAQVQS